MLLHTCLCVSKICILVRAIAKQGTHDMFFGREKETAVLNYELKKKSAFVIVYGTRRVGKTTLLKHVLEFSSDRTIYLECRKDSMKKNAERLLHQMEKEGFDFNREGLSDFELIFEYLNGFDETVNVVLDEYPYLKYSTKGEVVDSLFQSIVDGCLGNIRLFLSGSDVGMMKDLSSYDNALFGRASCVMELKQWDYKEASLCYPDKTPYEKVAYYSVFGGTPYINTQIDNAKTLRENVVNLYLKEGGAARLYTTYLLMTGSASVKDDTEPILEALGNGRRRYGELKKAADVEFDNTFTRRLDCALRMELIKKVFPINRPDDVKKASYEISDNVLRFYFTFIYGHEDELLGTDPFRFYDEKIGPNLTGFVSRRFEDICRSYFRNKIKSGEYKDAVRVGTYYFFDSENKTQGEYDVAVKKEPVRGLYCYDIYEVKYYEDTLTERALRRETDDVAKIKGMSIDKVGFVSINGFEQGCSGILISGEELYA